MLGTFLGLEISTRGLQSQQAAVEVSAHNIANANTPGFSRQRANLVTQSPLEWPGNMSASSNQIGTGVQVQQITRLRDQYLDGQYRDQNQYVGNWTVQQGTMDKITAVVNEPSNTGLSSVMQTFWNSWEKLGQSPGNLPAAMELKQDATTVTNTLNQMGQQFTQLSSDLTTARSATVDQVNSYVSQIAAVNKQIISVQQDGAQPNDLMDTRDSLVDSLSQLVDVKVDQSQGSYQLSISGTLALQDSQVKTTLAVTASPGQISTTQVQGGEIKGYEDSLATVSTYSNDLDSFAAQLANGNTQIKLAGTWQFPMPANGNFAVSGTLPDGTQFTAGNSIQAFVTAQNPLSTSPITIDSSASPAMVTVPAGTQVNVNGLNGLLKLGYSQTGQVATDFFTSGSVTPPITASNISVGMDAGQIGFALRPSVPTAPSTTYPGLDGDGTLAITINSMKSATLQFPDPSGQATPLNGTLDDFLQSVVGKLGIDTQEADRQVTNQTTLVQQVDNKRQAVSGVSIDEEMSNMVKFQQAYGASARMLTTIDQMLDTLINHTGIVGQ
jgi:flagellar hook-associated protein 1 FlgK